jgi:hypothetical protein
MMAVTDAVDFAQEGKVADGYACLVWGLHRAEERCPSGRILRGSGAFCSLEMT